MERKALLSHIQVEKGVQALLQLIEKRKEMKKQPLLEEEHAVNLQFATFKVPRIRTTVKLKLPNGLGQQHKEVCLFVKDLDRSDREYEKSVQHFKAFLKSKGISCVSEVIPLKALKLEHKPFEAKRNLSNRFDVFLADARIIRLLPSYLGKAFFSRKRQPVQVRMDTKDLKTEFEAAINNSRCVFSGKGSVGMATVGTSSMSVAELVQNITTSTNQIAAALPGGAENISRVYIKTEDSLAIPIYTSLAPAKDIKFPEPAKREPVVAEEVTTVENALVKVYPSGVVKLVDESGKVLSRTKKTRKQPQKVQKKPPKALKEPKKLLKKHKKALEDPQKKHKKAREKSQKAPEDPQKPLKKHKKALEKSQKAPKKVPEESQKAPKKWEKTKDGLQQALDPQKPLGKTKKALEEAQKAADGAGKHSSQETSRVAKRKVPGKGTTEKLKAKKKKVK